MRTQSRDTRPEAEKVLVSLLRNATTAQRISRVRSLSATAMQLSRRAVMRANPDLDEREVTLKCIYYYYGPELAERLREYMNGKSV